MNYDVIGERVAVLAESVIYGAERTRPVDKDLMFYAVYPVILNAVLNEKA